MWRRLRVRMPGISVDEEGTGSSYRECEAAEGYAELLGGVPQVPGAEHDVELEDELGARLLPTHWSILSYNPGQDLTRKASVRVSCPAFIFRSSRALRDFTLIGSEYSTLESW